jgi:hypothetical protein
MNKQIFYLLFSSLVFVLSTVFWYPTQNLFKFITMFFSASLTLYFLVTLGDKK